METDLSPEASTRQLVASAIEEARQIDPALPDLLRAIALQPDDADDYSWRGRVHYQVAQHRLTPSDGFRACVAALRQTRTEAAD